MSDQKRSDQQNIIGSTDLFNQNQRLDRSMAHWLAVIGALGLGITLIRQLLFPADTPMLGLLGISGLVAGGLFLLFDRFGWPKVGAFLMMLTAIFGILSILLVVPLTAPIVTALLIAMLILGRAVLDDRVWSALSVLSLLAFTLMLLQTGENLQDSGPVLLFLTLAALCVALFSGRWLVRWYERQLANNQQLFRLVIDTLPDTIYVKDTESRIVVCNKANARLLGIDSTEDAIGKTDYDFFPPELAADYIADEQALFANGTAIINKEENAIAPYGEHVWWLTSKQPFFNNNGQPVGLVGSGRFITEQKLVTLEREELLTTGQVQQDHLTALITQVRDTAKQLNQTASDLLAMSNQQSAVATEQNAAIVQTMATVEQVRQTVAQTAQQAQDVAADAEQSVTATRSGQQAVIDSMTGMATIEERVSSIAENILLLSEQTQQIGSIISTVNDLAEQSKLLALNASIEAARAGEEGRGFAVVALEVRQLAEQSSQATEQIRQILESIQQATNTAVMVTEEGSKEAQNGMALVSRAGEAIESLTNTVDRAAQASALIATSARQQSNGMEQLAAAMNTVREAGEQAVQSANQGQHSAADLNDLAGVLEGLVREDVNR